MGLLGRRERTDLTGSEDGVPGEEAPDIPGERPVGPRGARHQLRDLREAPRQVVAHGAGKQQLHPAIARDGRVLVSGLTQLALGGRELLLERRDLLHQLRDRGDIDHRELGVRRARVA